MVTINTNESHVTNSPVEHLFGLTNAHSEKEREKKKKPNAKQQRKRAPFPFTHRTYWRTRRSRSWWWWQNLPESSEARRHGQNWEHIGGKKVNHMEIQKDNSGTSASTPATLQNSPQPEDYICKASRLTPPSRLIFQKAESECDLSLWPLAKCGAKSETRLPVLFCSEKGCSQVTIKAI